MKALADGMITWIKQFPKSTIQAAFTPSGSMALLREEKISQIDFDGIVTAEMELKTHQWACISVMMEFTFFLIIAC